MKIISLKITVAIVAFILLSYAITNFVESTNKDRVSGVGDESSSPTTQREDAIFSENISVASSDEPTAQTSTTIDVLTADVASDDANKRSAAISALATAPKLQAIPVLQRVLHTGLDEDRQLAVQSLKLLAIQQGDDGGEIRDILRLAIYDGSNNEVVEVYAQNVLDDIEHEVDRMYR